MSKRSLVGLWCAVLLLFLDSGGARSRNSYLYDNLQRSLDALSGQRAELERSRSDILGQIDLLQQKVARIDQYLKQVDDSLQDVDHALNQL